MKRNRGVEQIKSRYGRLFTLPWLIGYIVFFAVPLIQSIWYAFCDMIVSAGDVQTTFIGLENFKEILFRDPSFEDSMQKSITEFLYSLPIILFLSMVLSIFLNQDFRGRLFFRSLYFLPVIIATGTVINIMFSTTSEDVSNMGVSESLTGSMFSIEDLLEMLNLDIRIATYVTNIINNIFDLVWSCGIQIVLFLAGLQTIPSSLYEASRVEGATKWEEFWFITFPMLGRVTLLVGVFTMVELIISTRTSVVSRCYSLMRSGVYDRSSAMLWFYFLVAGGLMAFIAFLYNRFLLKRWE